MVADPGWLVPAVRERLEPTRSGRLSMFELNGCVRGTTIVRMGRRRPAVADIHGSALVSLGRL